MKKLFQIVSYLWALNVANFSSFKTEWKNYLTMSFFMMVQNTIFFVLWMIFFRNISSLNGWGPTEVARLFGMAAVTCGLSNLFFRGVRTLAYRVQDGSLDTLLTRPRSPLPLLIFSEVGPSGLGDALYGPLMWIVLGHLSWAMTPRLILLSLMAASIFTSMALLFHSLSFWLKGNARFSEQLFECLIIFTSIVQHGQPWVVQAIMYTIMPAIFITYFPTLLMEQFDLLLFAQMIGATIFFALLAVVVFTRGVRRYKEVSF